jgi:DNA repair protein RecO (recombination protein O)
MHWDDEGIVLSVRKHGENKAIVKALVRAHGVFAGMLPGISSKTNRGVAQAGNRVNLHWSARLSEHIGMYKAELLTPHAALVMQDATKLAALASACAMLETLLPERHPYPKLYDALEAFLDILEHDGYWQEVYVRLELAILAECGFGLDLSSCAATGSTDDLAYVSPKSGRAVSRAAGEPYKDKMLPLPGFLIEENAVKPAEILAGTHLTGYFLEHWLAKPHGKKLPAARQRLVELLKEMHVEEAAA